MNCKKLSQFLVLTAGVVAGVSWMVRPRAPFPPWARPANRGAAWALVTGASSGLGAEFARQLAGRGYSLLLVARRADRLEALAAEFAATFGVAAETLTADLTTDAGVAAVEARIRALPQLEMLVNNAGFGTVGRLVNAEPARQEEMVYLHVMATMRLSQAALPGMTARKRGAIVNVSSLAAHMPLPGNVNYHATKAYINAFSEGLQAELGGTGVYVQALCPGYTHTEFHSTDDLKRFDKASSPAWLWMAAPDVVRASLNDIGSGRVVVVPGLRYKSLHALLRVPGLGASALQLAARFRRTG